MLVIVIVWSWLKFVFSKSINISQTPLSEVTIQNGKNDGGPSFLILSGANVPGWKDLSGVIVVFIGVNVHL